MTDTTLIQRLSDEADLCRNDGATDLAKLLDDAVYEIVRQTNNAMQLNLQVEALRADAETYRAALNVIAERQNSDWPDRCQALVNTARAALRQEQPDHIPTRGEMVGITGEGGQ